MATHSSILAWEIPWTEEPGELQSMGSQSPTRLNVPSPHHTSIFQDKWQEEHSPPNLATP